VPHPDFDIKTETEPTQGSGRGCGRVEPAPRYRARGPLPR
jgi:hypothetical protein